MNELIKLEAKRQLWKAGLTLLDNDSYEGKTINCEFEAINDRLRQRLNLNKAIIQQTYKPSNRENRLVRMFKIGQKITL